MTPTCILGSDYNRLSHRIISGPHDSCEACEVIPASTGVFLVTFIDESSPVYYSTNNPVWSYDISNLKADITLYNYPPQNIIAFNISTIISANILEEIYILPQNYENLKYGNCSLPNLHLVQTLRPTSETQQAFADTVLDNFASKFAPSYSDRESAFAHLNSIQAKIVVFIDDSGSMTRNLIDDGWRDNPPPSENANYAINIIRTYLTENYPNITFVVLNGCSNERWLSWLSYGIQAGGSITNDSTMECIGVPNLNSVIVNSQVSLFISDSEGDSYGNYTNWEHQAQYIRNADEAYGPYYAFSTNGADAITRYIMGRLTSEYLEYSNSIDTIELSFPYNPAPIAVMRKWVVNSFGVSNSSEVVVFLGNDGHRHYIKVICDFEDGDSYYHAIWNDIDLPINSSLLPNGTVTVAGGPDSITDNYGGTYDNLDVSFFGDATHPIYITFTSESSVVDVICEEAVPGPTNISLSPSIISENRPAGTTVGYLTTSDVDYQNVTDFTYTLNTQSDYFEILGNEVKTKMSFDYESLAFSNPYIINVTSTNPDGKTHTKDLYITIGNVNEPHTGITISNSQIAENAALNTVVGIFTTTDIDLSQPEASYSYSLVDGLGSNDNVSFIIPSDSNELQTNTSFDFETKSSYTIRVRSTDKETGFTVDEVFIITVTDVSDPPTDITIDNTSVLLGDFVYPQNIGKLTTIDVDNSDENGDFYYEVVSAYIIGDETNTNHGEYFIISTRNLRVSQLAPQQVNQYRVTIRSTEVANSSNSIEKEFTITVNTNLERFEASKTYVIHIVDNNYSPEYSTSNGVQQGNTELYVDSCNAVSRMLVAPEFNPYSRALVYGLLDSEGQFPTMLPADPTCNPGPFLHSEGVLTLTDANQPDSQELSNVINDITSHFDSLQPSKFPDLSDSTQIEAIIISISVSSEIIQNSLSIALKREIEALAGFRDKDLLIFVNPVLSPCYDHNFYVSTQNGKMLVKSNACFTNTSLVTENFEAVNIDGVDYIQLQGAIDGYDTFNTHYIDGHYILYKIAGYEHGYGRYDELNNRIEREQIGWSNAGWYYDTANNNEITWRKSSYFPPESLISEPFGKGMSYLDLHDHGMVQDTSIYPCFRSFWVMTHLMYTMALGQHSQWRIRTDDNLLLSSFEYAYKNNGAVNNLPVIASWCPNYISNNKECVTDDDLLGQSILYGFGIEWEEYQGSDARSIRDLEITSTKKTFIHETLNFDDPYTYGRPKGSDKNVVTLEYTGCEWDEVNKRKTFKYQVNLTYSWACDDLDTVLYEVNWNECKVTAIEIYDTNLDGEYEFVGYEIPYIVLPTPPFEIVADSTGSGACDEGDTGGCCDHEFNALGFKLVYDPNGADLSPLCEFTPIGETYVEQTTPPPPPEVVFI